MSPSRGSAPPASPDAPEHRGAALRARLERLVGRAQLVLGWEQAWPVIWRGLVIALVFVAASWLGLWLDLPGGLRMAGVALFGLALAAALFPLVLMRRPARWTALDRLDNAAGLAHGPARALDDSLALGGDDPGTRVLWALHLRRAEAEIGGLRPPQPRPGMARRDPRAIRAGALVAVAASAFVAGPEMGARLGAAFDWGDPPGAVPSFRVDGWVDPPLYTRLPPLVIDLTRGEQHLRAPVGSTVVVRVAGSGEASITPGRGLEAVPPAENAAKRQDLKEWRYVLKGDSEVSVRTGLTGRSRLVLEAVPDRPPEIIFAGHPEVNARGSFSLLYRAKDDYGIASAEGVVAPADAGGAAKRTLVPPPRIPLALPGDSQGETDTRTLADLTTHPWAGARVKLTLVAKDGAEQEGRSATLDFTLPVRPFTKPLARALAEQRRKLVLDPDDRRRVQTGLDALLIAPEQFTPQPGVFLGLRTASSRLRRARSDEDLVEVADWLWAMALQVEEGDLSNAEREMRAAQDRLREALDRNAPDDEIKRFTDELRQAMDRFLSELADKMRRDSQEAEQQDRSGPEKLISRDDLNRMVDRMQEAMRRGDMAEAQRLLEELRNIMENLRTARPGSRGDPLAREMNKSMDELDAMAREQQELREDTFREGQDGQQSPRSRGDRRQGGQQGQRQRGERGEQGQGQQGQKGQQGQQGQQGRQGQKGERGQGQGQGGLGQRQQGLRERLEALQRGMKELGIEGEQGLAEAEGAMREAEGALGQGGQEGQAVDAQGRALEGLRKGAQGLAQQMQQMMGDGTDQAGDQPGNGNPNAQGRASQRDTDPLGRPTRGRNFSDGQVRVPGADESAVERARRIMEELRRRLGDPSRPSDELEYLERLLRRQ